MIFKIFGYLDILLFQDGISFILTAICLKILLVINNSYNHYAKNDYLHSENLFMR